MDVKIQTKESFSNKKPRQSDQTEKSEFSRPAFITKGLEAVVTN